MSTTNSLHLLTFPDFPEEILKRLTPEVREAIREVIKARDEARAKTGPAPFNCAFCRKDHWSSHYGGMYCNNNCKWLHSTLDFFLRDPHGNKVKWISSLRDPSVFKSKYQKNNDYKAAPRNSSSKYRKAKGGWEDE